MIRHSHSPNKFPVERQYCLEQAYPQSQSGISTPFVPSHFFTNPSQNYFEFGVDDVVSKAGDIDVIPSHPSMLVFKKMIEQEQEEPRLLYPSPEKHDRQALSQKFTMRTDRQFMSQEERIAFYDFVDNILGPPSGVQELVGTYKSYMAEQSRLFFERILPSSHDHMRKVQAQTYVRSQTTSQSQVQAQSSSDSVDFRRWLVSDSSADSSLNDQQSSASHYYSDGRYMPGVLPAKRRSSTSVFAERAPYGGENDLACTLDDLFPRLKAENLPEDEALGSPVERSRPDMSHYGSIALDNWRDYMAEDHDMAFSGSPPLVTDFPATQQTSPDIDSSPFIQTPTSVYQQFIQRKNPHVSPVHPSQAAQWAATLQDDHDMHNQVPPSPRIRCQNDGTVLQTAEVMFTEYNPNNYDGLYSKPDYPKISVTRTTSRVARMRTSSAGGGI